MPLPHVLVIEDDVVLGRLLTQALRAAGFATDYAVDGEKGLAAFLIRRYDIVVTDIIMPEREGLETLREIRKAAPNVKIVAMSGGGRIGADSFLELARYLGADITLQKPFLPSKLVEIVGDLRWRMSATAEA